MTFVSVLLALIAEQFRALGRNNPIYDIVRVLSGRAEHAFDTGRTGDARLAWLTVVVPLTLAVMVVHYLLASISVALTLAWNVLLLYLTLGFRQFSHYFTDIHEALNRDDLPAARALLHEWTGLDTMEMPVTEIVRHTLEAAIVAAHRHVFGVFFWFLVPIGRAAWCSTAPPSTRAATGTSRRPSAARRWAASPREPSMCWTGCPRA